MSQSSTRRRHTLKLGRRRERERWEELASQWFRFRATCGAHKSRREERSESLAVASMRCCVWRNSRLWVSRCELLSMPSLLPRLSFAVSSCSCSQLLQPEATKGGAASSLSFSPRLSGLAVPVFCILSLLSLFFSLFSSCQNPRLQTHTLLLQQPQTQKREREPARERREGRRKLLHLTSGRREKREREKNKFGMWVQPYDDAYRPELCNVVFTRRRRNEKPSAGSSFPPLDSPLTSGNTKWARSFGTERETMESISDLHRQDGWDIFLLSFSHSWFFTVTHFAITERRERLTPVIRNRKSQWLPGAGSLSDGFCNGFPLSLCVYCIIVCTVCSPECDSSTRSWTLRYVWALCLFVST